MRGGVDWEAWLGSSGRFDHAVAYAGLFWPEFVEVDGCVLIGSSVPETYAEWKARYPNDPRVIETVLNHRHLLDLFETDDNPSPELVRVLGRALSEMWTAKLHRDFPDLVVSFPEDFDLAFDNPDITFYTKRDPVRSDG